MELTELKDRLISKYAGSEEGIKNLLELFENDRAVFPFNEYELMITTMLSQEKITYSDYLDIRAEYIGNNPNLWLFEISAPRLFGEQYAQTLLQTMHPALRKPTKKLDKEYRGQYDLLYNDIKIEVKASRVTDKDIEGPMYKKALSIGTTKNFLMNFQQVKPQCCDVFVLMAVYRDATTFWVMSSEELSRHKDYSVGQHRGNSGKEGQLHITKENIASLDNYISTGAELLTKIESAARSKV